MNRVWASTLLLLCLCALLAHSKTATINPSPYPDDGMLSPFFWIQNATGTEALPLNASRLDVDVNGVIGEMKITQIYQNRGASTIDATYVFPASTRASIRAMQMLVNGRLVIGQLYDATTAKVLYNEAKALGKTVSLLEMQRPNVLAMSLGNILPGDIIRVEIFYTELFVPLADVYSFLYPAVVAPRYTTATGGFLSTTPVTGVSPTFIFRFECRFRAGKSINFIRSPTHDITLTGSLFAGAVNVSLAPNATGVGTRDILIEYMLSANTTTVGSLFYDASKDDGYGGPFRTKTLSATNTTVITWDTPRNTSENFFLTFVQPSSPDFVGIPTPREFLFIIDTSGSTAGFPHETIVALVNKTVMSLRPTDYFNMLAFAGSTTVFQSTSVSATPSNLQAGLNYLASTVAAGGTDIMSAFNRAVAIPRILQTVARTVIVLTDGLVTVEASLFQLIRDNVNNSNFFAFSIGPSPNRYLTEGVATVGRGLEFWVPNATFVDSMTQRFLQFALVPTVSNVQVTFDPSFEAFDILPVPSQLLSERPLLITGKYTNPLPSQGLPLFTVTGTDAYGQPWNATIFSPGVPNSRENRGLPYLWARAMIEDYRFTTALPEASILLLALKYNILTEYTSFLAIDQLVRFNRTNVDVANIDQPIPLPDGLDSSALGDVLKDPTSVGPPQVKPPPTSTTSGPPATSGSTYPPPHWQPTMTAAPSALLSLWMLAAALVALLL